MNLDGLDEALGRFEGRLAVGPVGCWRLESGGHRSLFLDSWHFSAWNKEDEEDYYLPICEAIRRHRTT